MSFPNLPCKRAIALSFCVALSVSAMAQQPELLKDVNQSSEITLPSSPERFIAFKGELYFKANDGNFGAELWKSDGTPTGTAIVKDINPGAFDSSPLHMAVVNDFLYFNAFHPTFGNELWRTDGTEAGTKLVMDINPGSTGNGPTDLVQLNGSLFFAAGNAAHGRELWKSDGTEAGTVMVKDIWPGAGSSLSITNFGDLANNFAVVGNTLFFSTSEGVNGKELWKSDGTAEGTMMVKDIAPGTASTKFTNLRAAGNVLYFTADDGIHGKELWKSDGTEEGTMIVENIPGGNKNAGPSIWFNGKVYFSSTMAGFGDELWTTDGTESGTRMVKDIFPGESSSIASDLVVMGDYFYFAASEPFTGIELWRSDGTEEGTVLVKDANAYASSFPTGMCAVGNTLFFRGLNENFVFGVWKTDGTEAGTEEITIPDPVNNTPIFNLTAVGEIAFFTADNGFSGRELWKSDGTTGGTFAVKDINTTSKFFPQGLGTSGDALLFINNQNTHSYEVWKSDGTTGGTSLVKDIFPGTVSFAGVNATFANGRLFFTVNDGVNGEELWVSDGSEEGTALVKDINPGETSSHSAISLPVVIGQDVLFTAYDGTNAFGALWKSDGTEPGTLKVKESFPTLSISNLRGVAGDKIFAFDSWKLWVSDKTEAGSVFVKDINPSKTGWFPTGMVDNNGALFFGISDGVHGYELWKSDGTAEGTVLVKDINQNLNNNHFITLLGAANGILYFSANDDVHGFELWKSDGTEAGTTLVKDIWPGESSGNISGFNFMDNTVYFLADDGVHGKELWKTDGTDAGTSMVKDMNPGPMTSNANLTNDNAVSRHGVLYFSADDGIHGTEVWRSDGTDAGTYMLDEINPSALPSFPRNFVSNDNTIFFTAVDGTHGREVWKIDVSAPQQPQSITFDPIPDKIANDAAFAVTARADSGLPVAFSIVSGPAVISGNMVTLTGSGSIIVRASQPGNEHYLPATDVEQSFSVSKAEQQITFPPISDKTIMDSPFELQATSTSGLPVKYDILIGRGSVSGYVFTVAKVGRVSIQASQPGNAIYKPADNVSRSFLVLPARKSRGIFTVFPNPASEYLTTTWHGESQANVTLLNTYGETVWKATMKGNSLRIPLSDLPAGVYVLRARSSGFEETVRVFVK